MRATRVAHVVIALGLVATYPFVTADVQSFTYPLSALVAVVAVLAGVRAHRPAATAPWLLLAGAFGMYLLGDLLNSAYLLLYPGDIPFPWLSDIAYLLFYPVLFVALARFLGTRDHENRSAWLDAQIWTLGAALLAWKPLIEPYLVDTEATSLARAVAIAYPLLDLGLLLMVVRLMADAATRRPAGLLLAGSLLLQTGTDFVYSIRSVEGLYMSGELTDTGWLLTYAIVGAAALHPSMVGLTEAAVRPPELSSRGRLLGLLAPALLAPCVLILQMLTGTTTGRDTIVVAVAFIALLLLVTARGSGVLAVAERRASDLRVRQSELEKALRERDRFTGELQNAMRDNEHFTSELRRRAEYDSLTQLASRDRFTEELSAALVRGQSGGPRPSVAFLDLDDFKTVNDTLGHAVGDMLLIEVACRLRAAMGSDQLVARFGGDEFAVLVLGDVERAADRMLEVLRAPLELASQDLRVEVSIGVTTAHGPETSSGDLLREADMAMYAAKAAGGGWTRYRSAMSSAVLQRLNLRARLTQGLTDDEIRPWYQPVVELGTGRLVGFEALARWCQAGQTALPPGEWLPWAEQSGMVVGVDRTVVRAAIEQLAEWRGRFGVSDLDLAVNMSGRSLQVPGMEQELLDVLRTHGVPAERLILEVTEGVLIDDDRISTRLQRLRSAGVRIALDDFGTGWSSLSNLRRLPVDQLKLDRSFTAELGRGRASEAVPAAIIQLSRALSLDVVAEGVETPEQRDELIRLGFDAAQGYLFGPAVRARDVVEMVSDHGATSRSARTALRPGSPLSVVR